jgi:uncharacterized repeat protein (TIGR01451 family)
VSVSGDTVVVGAREDGAASGREAGSVYVFVRSGAVWSEQQKLVASDGGALQYFGLSVSVSGDTLVVGQLVDAAYVFVRSGTVWSQQQKLAPAGGATKDQFGRSVSVSGDTAVVGAPGIFGAGSAHVFVRSGTVWTEQQKLVASDGAAFDGFGNSVSVSGNTAVVGAPYDVTAGGADTGAAYVFVRSGTVWSEQQKLVASDGAAGDSFGHSASVYQDTAVVGAYADDRPGGLGSGSAYLFERSGAVWSEQQKLVASDPAELDHFGESVSVFKDMVLVGASGGGLSGPGSAYVFVKSGTVWSQQQKLVASDGTDHDSFGSAVSVSGDTAVVGALFLGAAYTFVLQPAADLGVNLTDGVPAIAPGGSLTYTLTVTNAGPDAATGATVVDAFPAVLGCSTTCVGTSGTTCTAGPFPGNIDDIVTLPAGGTLTYTSSCTLSASATGTLTNTATVTATATVRDLNLANNSATDVDVIGVLVTGTKTVAGNFAELGAVAYMVTLTNSGITQADNPGDEFSDTLPSSLTLVAANASSGTTGTAGNTVSWNGSIPTASSMTITIDATINAGTAGEVISNQGSISFDANADGTHDTNALTDDPTLPGASDPTVFQPASGPLAFHTLTPCRVLDTRNAIGPLGGPALVAGDDRTFTIVGTCGIPVTARAVSVNIAATAPTALGNLRLRASGTAVPLASSINYAAGQTRANNAVLFLNPSGQIAVFCAQASGTVHLILDANGYFE